MFNKEILTVKQVSSFLSLHPKTIYRWAKESKLPHIKINNSIRFDREEIEKLIETSPEKKVKIVDFLPKFDLSLESYDKLFLKGRSVLSKKSKRWNYGFGAVYIRETKQGKERWYIDCRVNGKRIRQLVENAQNRGEAVLVLQEKIAEAFDKAHNSKREIKKIKFSEFAAQYLEDYAKVNKKSWRSDESYLKSLRKFLGEKYISDITALDTEKYKAGRLKEGVTKTTVNRCLQILKRMFNLAIDWEYTTENPVRKVRLFSEKDNLKERILSLDEEKRLLEEASEKLKPIIRVALNTGMRRGEILNLGWAQIDFQKERIRVENTKSGKRRFIEINSMLLKELQKLKNLKGKSEFVFPNPKTGKPFADVKRPFKNACRKAEIENLRFHDLRHSFASRLIEKGVDLITVKDLLGHSTVTITQRYTHSNSEQKKRAVELLVENPLENAKNLESLAHICHMEKKEEGSKSLNDITKPLFSIN